MEALLSARRGGAVTAQLPVIDLLALDFDGVLTDNRVIVNEHGVESVQCDRGDGMGIARLRQAGVSVVVISTEANPVVSARCRKLGIHCVQACHDKLGALQSAAMGLGIGRTRVAYVGNDVNDLKCMGWAGLSIAVADARAEALAAARWVTRATGGAGAVREVCDQLIEARDAATGEV